MREKCFLSINGTDAPNSGKSGRTDRLHNSCKKWSHKWEAVTIGSTVGTGKGSVGCATATFHNDYIGIRRHNVISSWRMWSSTQNVCPKLLRIFQKGSSHHQNGEENSIWCVYSLQCFAIISSLRLSLRKWNFIYQKKEKNKLISHLRINANKLWFDDTITQNYCIKSVKNWLKLLYISYIFCFLYVMQKIQFLAIRSQIMTERSDAMTRTPSAPTRHGQRCVYISSGRQ